MEKIKEIIQNLVDAECVMMLDLLSEKKYNYLVEKVPENCFNAIVDKYPGDSINEVNEDIINKFFTEEMKKFHFMKL